MRAWRLSSSSSNYLSIYLCLRFSEELLLPKPDKLIEGNRAIFICINCRQRSFNFLVAAQFSTKLEAQFLEFILIQDPIIICICE